MPWNARKKDSKNTPKLPAGTRISHYEIIKKVGSTALGAIYLADDTWKRRRVTLKIFSDSETVDPKIREAMLESAERASKIEHPNLLGVHEVDQTDGRDYIVMEYAEGVSLMQMLYSGSLSVDGIVDITRQLCSGLRELHDNRTLAKLLLPEQIIITKDKRVKLVNFGMFDTDFRETGDIESLPTDIVCYFSPEQVNYRDVDERSNIFSLGALIYTMAARRRAFTGDTGKAVVEAVRGKEPEPPMDINPDIPERLNRIIVKMLNKNPIHRYQDIGEVVTDLAYFKPAPGYEIYAPKKKDSWNWVVLVALIILLLISFWGYIKEMIQAP